MARLPQPGSDDNTWGNILNEFLLTSLNPDGTLQVTALPLDSDTSLAANSDSKIATQKATKAYVDATVAAGTPDATTSSKGKIQLAGDLGGTAASPTVPGLAGKQNANANLTAIAGLTPSNDDVLQRKAGAWTNRTPAQLKTDLTLTKNDVNLGNVDNTSDANKPISTATQTALGNKEPVIAAGTTSQYWRGDKSWQTLDKTAVGLTNVDNTSDANKPLSTAAAAAIRTMQLKIIDDATVLTTGDNKLIFCIPSNFTGLNLIDADAFVSANSSSGSPTIQLRNISNANSDMLSTRMTIDVNQPTTYTASTQPVIDLAKDNVATGDLISVDVDVAGTGAKGLGIILRFG